MNNASSSSSQDNSLQHKAIHIANKIELSEEAYMTSRRLMSIFERKLNKLENDDEALEALSIRDFRSLVKTFHDLSIDLQTHPEAARPEVENKASSEEDLLSTIFMDSARRKAKTLQPDKLVDTADSASPCRNIAAHKPHGLSSPIHPLSKDERMPFNFFHH